MNGKAKHRRAGRRRIYRGVDHPIANRWFAKQAAVFGIELTRAFVSNLKGDSRCVNVIGEHPRPRGLQLNLLLILRRSHSREAPEVMMSVVTASLRMGTVAQPTAKQAFGRF
jgi:hypothetical protein